MSRLSTFLLALTLYAQTAEAPPPFSDITAASKLDFVLQHSPTTTKFLPETMGGGVALFDYDNDGRLDLFFVNGAKLGVGGIPDKSEPRFWNRLYHQKADGTFEDLTERSGLKGERYGMGVATGDYDGDGLVDLYVTGVGGSNLYRNKGNGVFEDVTANSRAGVDGWSTSAGFLDYNNDGRLDLFVCRYVKYSWATERVCGANRPGGRSYCHPDQYEAVSSVLLRNDGDGRFSDVSGSSGIAKSPGKALGVAFADYDLDGDLDIYVANDSVQSQLFRNNGDGTFSEIAIEAGAGFNEDGATFAGMGVDFADYDNDGRPDVFVTDLSNERYMLYRNSRDRTFTVATNESGVGAATRTYSGWSTRFFDYDNDGWKDLFVAQGHVMDNIESTSPNLRYKQPLLLLRNIQGLFRQIPMINDALSARGAAFGDIDNDGDIDVVVTVLGEHARILRNDVGQSNGWIRVVAPSGARVRVVSASGLEQHFTAGTGAGYLSAHDGRILAGLGRDKSAKLVEIKDFLGKRKTLQNVSAGSEIDTQAKP